VGQLVLGLVIGALLGAALCALVLARRAREGSGQIAAAGAARAAAEARAGELAATVERERESHAAALASLSDRFKVLAGETLETVVRQFHEGQVQILEQREAKLDERLDPLAGLLREYKAKVEELETNREKGFVNVQNAADRLLEAQRGVMDETRRLNTILGRSSSRGRWGEIQLERILEISGMTKHVDFDPQVTLRSPGEERQRPDVVVHLPHGANIAIDAKVPFDAFDRAMDTDDEAERDAALREYAGAMRQHIGELRRKEYWSSLKTAPTFVVCFVPSDHLLSAAFDADPDLLSDALKARVLVAGPTTLLGLLWSTWLGWSQFDAATNIEEITELATRLVDRTATLIDHVDRLGTSISNSSKHYGSLVGSLEGSLLVTVRDIQRRGIRSHKELGTLSAAPEPVRRLDPERWPRGTDELITVEAEVVEPHEAEVALELDAGEGD
jgi:DNA recombination protein RmuC